MKPRRVDPSLPPAEVCCFCPRPHYMTTEDRLRHAAGARVSHGMCKAAAERWMLELEKDDGPSVAA